MRIRETLVRETLVQVEEYLARRCDVKDGSDGVQLPNEAMSLLLDVELAIRELDRPRMLKVSRINALWRCALETTASKFFHGPHDTITVVLGKLICAELGVTVEED